MSTREGDWFQTFTGVEFYIFDPRPEEVRLEDIAHALALQCRFNGHCRDFYSVAEHSVRVSRVVEGQLAGRRTPLDRIVVLWGLLHDAAEAYAGDMVRPMKRSMPSYRAVEEKLMNAVCVRFGLGFDEPGVVKHADNVLLATEKRDLMAAPAPRDWQLSCVPLADHLVPWSPREAEALFLARYYELTEDRHG